MERLDIVILNAGIMALPPGLTKDGYELQFGTNHLGHALLLKLLLPVLEKTAHGGKGDVRVVSITTGFQNAAMVKIDFDKKKTTQDEWLMGPWVRFVFFLFPFLFLFPYHILYLSFFGKCLSGG